jgi:aminopeptidase-like protein
MECKNEIYTLLKRLFPINRSLTGDGVRETLSILQEYIPIKTHELPSGSQVFDWTVPDEWNIKDAYIKDEKGNRIVDFNATNLHVVGYSEPFEGTLSLDELKPHIYTLPEQPDIIPYVTSYYKRRWGFCMSHNQFLELKEQNYHVKIDSTLEPGSLTYADLIIKGKSEEEILLSTYVCHPSMANNELSGPLVTTYLAKYLLENQQNLDYSYRIVFIPETIGAIVYLAMNKDEMISKVKAGYVITSCGDPGPFSYLKTRWGNTMTDRISLHVLENTEKIETEIYDFIISSSDERQYNAPGIDLEVGSLMRSKYGTYPEYHTSADNLDFVTGEALEDTVNMYIKCLTAFEKNNVYQATILGEPQLGKRGLYPSLSRKEDYHKLKRMKNLISYCDGKTDLLTIAEIIQSPIWDLYPIVDLLEEHNIIVKKD